MIPSLSRIHHPQILKNRLLWGLHVSILSQSSRHCNSHYSTWILSSGLLNWMELSANQISPKVLTLLLTPPWTLPTLATLPLQLQICVVFAGPASVLSSGLLLTWLLISKTQQTQHTRMELTPFSLPIILPAPAKNLQGSLTPLPITLP